MQIKELQIKQESIEKELFGKTIVRPEDNADDLCPRKRKDLLYTAIHEILVEEKVYRDPALNRDSLIEKLGTNKELFIDAFMHRVGMPFPEYVNTLRLKDAVTLLEESDLTIEEISRKAGFGTVRTFQRRFQSKYNMSPKEYRNSLPK